MKKQYWALIAAAVLGVAVVWAGDDAPKSTDAAKKDCTAKCESKAACPSKADCKDMAACKDKAACKDMAACTSTNACKWKAECKDKASCPKDKAACSADKAACAKDKATCSKDKAACKDKAAEGAKKACCAKSCPVDMSKGTVDAKGLKAMLDDGKPVTVVDARTAKYDDGNRVPGAIALPADADDAAIAAALPAKDACIVAYCSNTQCPASKNLAARLKDLGYQNVFVMPEGIAGWLEAGYTAIQKPM